MLKGPGVGSMAFGAKEFNMYAKKNVYCADNEFQMRSQCITVKCIIGRVMEFNYEYECCKC